MDIQGQLIDFPLNDLLQLCVDTLISGALCVTTPEGPALVYFQEGHLYHATGPDGEGFDALWPLFELTDAPYQFQISKRTPSRTVNDTTVAVLQRAEALAADWRRLRPQIKNSRVVPELTTPPTSDHVQINEEDWPVLSCIDGVRTIGEVAHEAMLDIIPVCKSLLHLQQRGLVQLGPPRARSAQPPASDSDSEHTEADIQATTGFFSKILAALPNEPGLQGALRHSMRGDASFETDEIVRLLRTS